METYTLFHYYCGCTALAGANKRKLSANGLSAMSLETVATACSASSMVNIVIKSFFWFLFTIMKICSVCVIEMFET